MARAMGRRELAITGAIAMVLVVALSVGGFRVATGALDDPVELQAVFPRVGQGLDTFSDVRIKGVPIGSVTAIELDEQGRPVVSFALDRGVRVPEDATAAIEASSIFGPTSIVLHVGDDPRGPFLADGDTITATTPPTQLDAMLTRVDRLLASVDPDELGFVLSTGARLADSLAPRLGPMLDSAQVLTAVAQRHTDDGTRLLADLQRLTAELDGQPARLAAIGRDVHELVPVVVELEPEVAELLDASIRAAHTVSDVLERHPDAASQLGQGLLPSVLPPLAAVAGNLDVLPTFVEVVSVFFGELASVMHLDGPNGQRLGAIEMYVPPSLCELADVLGCYRGAP